MIVVENEEDNLTESQLLWLSIQTGKIQHDHFLNKCHPRSRSCIFLIVLQPFRGTYGKMPLWKNWSRQARCWWAGWDVAMVCVQHSGKCKPLPNFILLKTRHVITYLMMMLVPRYHKACPKQWSNKYHEQLGLSVLRLIRVHHLLQAHCDKLNCHKGRKRDNRGKIIEPTKIWYPVALRCSCCLGIACFRSNLLIIEYSS